MMKICIKCNKDKELDNFNFRKLYGTYNNICKECIGIQNKAYYANNIENIHISQQVYRQQNKKNIRLYNNDYEREKRKNNPFFKLRKNCSRLISFALNGRKNGKSILKYLPYTIDELKTHIESQFEPWMSWNNNGTYSSNNFKIDDPLTWTWHLDHIIPQSKLPYSSMTDENFKKCWALENLRPLKSLDNMKKSNKL